MIPKGWTIEFYLVLGITAGLALSSIVSNDNHGFGNNWKGSAKAEKEKSSRNIVPSKRFVKTINDQLRQVITKLPKTVHRQLTPRHFEPSTRKKSPWLSKRKFNSHGENSELVPDSGVIVEVFDNWRGDNNDFLKRDEIRRPEVTQGNLGIRHDRMGIKHSSPGMTRGNMSKKERLEQSVTEVIDDNEGNDHDIPGSTQRGKSSNSSQNVKIRKTSIPGSPGLQDIDEHDLESLRKLVKNEKDKSDNDKDKLINYNSNHDDDDNNDKTNNIASTAYLDAIAERYGITNRNDKLSTSIDVKTDNNKTNVSNLNKSIDVKDNNNDTTSTILTNNNDIVTNNRKGVAEQDREIQELIDSIGNLKSKGGGISDEQLRNLKETVQMFLSQKTATDEKQSKNEAFETSGAQWGQWAVWSACSVSCDNGKRSRTRTCGSKLNVNDNTCPGSGVQAQSCFIRHCPVNGGYTDWTSWSSCSETCGQQSLQLRMRICMDPRPQYGGKDCPGSRFRIRHCTVPPCQDDLAMEESGDKDNVPDDSNEILHSLKTVLQLKTSSLEEKLSDEQTDSASALFDSIYQGRNDTASSDISRNASTSDDDQNSSEDVLKKANTAGSGVSTAVIPDTVPDRDADGVTDTLLKLDHTVSNKTFGSPGSDEGLHGHEGLPSNEKVTTLNVHLKKTNDTADLQRLSALVGNLDSIAGDETSRVSTKISGSAEPSLKGAESDILGKINANGRVVESSLRVNHAWESSLLDWKHEVEKIGVNSSGNGSSAAKFDSIPVHNNETILTEIYAQNSTLNAASSKISTFKKMGTNHVPNSTITNEENSSKSGHESSKELDTRILNASKLEKAASSEKSGTDHVQVILPKDAHNVDNHVRLRTASVSTTGNGTSSSSIMGVIRYDADTQSNRGNTENVLNNTKIQIHDNGEWGTWASCSRSCGRGYQTRRKEICLEMPASGEYDCSHVKVQKKPCGDTQCPDELRAHLVKVHKLQNKKVLGLVRQNDISTADRIPQDLLQDVTGGSKHETEIMGLVRQELDADFLPWSSWSACSFTCGKGGTRTRTRRCQGKNKPNCIGPSFETKTCFLIHCPVKGQWSDWSHWTLCSRSCGKSLKLRMRKCDNPAPAHGGEKCIGGAEEQMKCDVPACSVNGHWSMWSAWSNCPVTCGKALKQRARLCNNPPPSNGGLACDGKSTEHLDCYLPSCPINGGFSHWQSWSRCHKTCGENSFRTRFRFCNNPPPSDGGKTCHGDRLQVSKCSNKPCTEPINGGFSQWSNWSSCSLDCRTGSVKYRTRMCDNPAPLYGGLECAGDDTEYVNCSADECKVDGGFSDWTGWSSCSQTCGDTAVKSRERSCTKPPPSGGGKNCSGETFEIKLCEKKRCQQVVTTPAPVHENEQTDTPLVQTIIDEKEQLLTEKKSGNNALFSDLKKKLIENLKKLAPDLGLSLGNSSSTRTVPTPEKANEVTNTNEPTATQAMTEVRDDTAQKKLGKKENLGDLKEQLSDPDGEGSDQDLNPIKSCGFNPCRLAKCLSDPFADCFPNSNCDPVYYDTSGNVKKDCNVETTFLTAPARQLCERDPCEVSMCLKLPMTKCLTSALCKPVYFDETGNVLNCTGVLKTPVRLTCGKDPCVGKLCPVDAEARCFTDYECKSTFWNLNTKEEVNVCKEPNLEPQEDEDENAEYRSQTPIPHISSPFKKTLRRPWLRLSKSALDEILKHNQGNDILMAHAKLKHFHGNNRLSSAQPGLTMILNEHNNDVDQTTTSDDDTKHYDERDNDNNNIPFTLSASKKPEVSLSGVPASKLKQYNNPRKNPILTLTSLNTDQYQSQGGNGVSVTKDWRLRLKPPIHLNGYVESPQVYKVNMLTHDKDQNAEEYLFRHQKNGLSSEGLSPQRLNAEGTNAEGLNSQRLISEEKISDGLFPERLHLAGVPPGRLSLEGLSSDEGLNPERLSSEGLHSDYSDMNRGSTMFTPASNSISSIDRLLKTDEAHVRSDGIDIAHAVTASPYDKILNQDITDVERALSNAEGQIPGEGRLSGLGSPVVPQTLAASIRSPEVEKQSQLNLAELQVRHDVVPHVGDPRAIPTEMPADDLAESEEGRYVPLDSVINDLQAHVGSNNMLNDNLGLP